MIGRQPKLSFFRTEPFK